MISYQQRLVAILMEFDVKQKNRIAATILDSSVIRDIKADAWDQGRADTLAVRHVTNPHREAQR